MHLVNRNPTLISTCMWCDLSEPKHGIVLEQFDQALKDQVKLAISGKGIYKTRAINDLIDHTRRLKNSDFFPRYLISLCNAIITRSDDLGELSHWKISLMTLDYFSAFGDFTELLAKGLKMILEDKLRQHPERFETVWNPKIPENNFAVRGKTFTKWRFTSFFVGELNKALTSGFDFISFYIDLFEPTLALQTGKVFTQSSDLAGLS